MSVPEIPEEACEYRYVHASGPGGQHVNKTSTAVELRVDVAKLARPAGPLAYAPLRRLREQQKNRINKDGFLIVQADRHRSQLKNKNEARERVLKMLAACLVAPKKRIATRPSKSAKQKRMNHKKQRGQVKVNRRKPPVD